MSASSMASVAIQRSPESRRPDGARAGGSAVESDNAFTAAMKAVTTYIPTDVLALYVAGSAVFLNSGASSESTDYDKAWFIFFGSLVATPLVNGLVFMAKLRSAGVAIPRVVSKWPIWESIAAMIAFVAWAAAMPATPFAEFGWYDAAFAGFLLGVVSLFLGLISSIILPTATKPAPPVDSQPPPGPLPGQ